MQSHEETIGTRSLWRAVISQAILDATLAKPEGAYTEGSQQAARDTARRWLLRPNKDFEEACALADLEPDEVRALAKREIEASGERGFKNQFERQRIIRTGGTREVPGTAPDRRVQARERFAEIGQKKSAG